MGFMRCISMQATESAFQLIRQHPLTTSMSIRSFPGIQWLDSLRNFEKSAIPEGAATATSATWDLSTMHSLLHHMHNPQEDLQRVIHVVGTKGKGSAAVMLDAILQAAGYKVGRYSSPHMQCPGERISIDGRHLSWAGFNDLICKNMPTMKAALLEHPSISYFEAFTALAINHFADDKVDWVIMEAGLGGVKDATNVFRPDQVKATLITALEREHLVPLGGSINSIALAKAGIVHPGGLVVVSTQPLNEGCAALSVALQQLNISRSLWVQPDALQDLGTGLLGSKIWQIAAVGPELVPVMGIDDMSLQMVGEHQVKNAAAASTVIKALNESGCATVSPVQVRAGLAKAHLPGRFSLALQTQHAVGTSRHHGAATWWLCMDTAHTALSCESLVATLQAAFPQQPPLALVVGMAADKDLHSISRVLKELEPCLVVCVALDEELSSRALPPEDVAFAFELAIRKSTGVTPTAETQVYAASSMSNARDIVFEWIQRIQGHSAQPRPANVALREIEMVKKGRLPVVCVTGSNYIVGSAMEVFRWQTNDTEDA